MSSASTSTLVLSDSLPVPRGVPDFPATERDRRNQRIEQWTERLQPNDPLEHWLVGRAASVTLDLERLERTEAEERQTQFVRASYCWDTDRQIVAEELALKLRKNPGAVSRKLRGFKQGASWMCERWIALRWSLDEGIDWNEAQRTLALDLLGMPETERDGPTAIDAPPDRAEHQLTGRRHFADTQIETLTNEIAGPLSIVDKQEQRQAVLGHGPAQPGSALLTIRREIAAATRQLRWALDTFHKVRNDHFTAIEAPGQSNPEREIECEPASEAREPNEPNLPDEPAAPTLLIGTTATPISARSGGNRRARRALARSLKRRHA